MSNGKTKCTSDEKELALILEELTTILEKIETICSKAEHSSE